jgi:hypothetical protein
MDKVEIKANLEEAYTAFIHYTQHLSQDEYEYAPEGKWNAGEQTLHLIKSVKPVMKGLGMPKFLIKYKFGKANRPSQGYNELVARYQKGLSENQGLSIKTYAPSQVSYRQSKELNRKLKAYIEEVNELLDKWNEQQLDKIIAPHPLLGKVTFREILYFTIYHAKHHQLQIKRHLKGI